MHFTATSTHSVVRARSPFRLTQATNVQKSAYFTGFVLLLQLLFLLNANAATSTEITVDHAAKTLVAPAAESYQWYYNEQRIEGSNAKALKVSKSGHYTVELIAKNGRTSRQSALIVVKGNAIKKIYLIGDSTVMGYSSSAYPQAGWGQTLPYFFNSSQVQIINKAIGGRSSKSFHVEGRWATVRDGLQSGDFVFIQFGHNDRDFSKPERYADTATYKRYLRIYVNETRAKGAFPVLVTPMIMNAWRNGILRNVFTEGANDYRGAMVQVATQLRVPLIDLNMKSYNLLQPLGVDYMSRFVYLTLAAGEYPNYPNGISDGTHFQEMGAIDMARLIVEGIRGLSGDANVNTLIPSLVPTYSVTVTSNTSAGGLITRSSSYPAGVTVTVKALPNSGYRLTRWSDGANAQVSTAAKFSFLMGTSARSYKATFESTSTPSTGLVSGATYTITARHSGQVIDVVGKSLDNAANIAQYPARNSTNQQWVVSRTSDGYYQFKAVHSGKNMDVAARSLDDSANIEQYTASTTATNQQFQLVDAGGGYYTLKARHSGKCVEVAGASTANSANIQQFTCGSGTHQQFKFDRVSTARIDVSTQTLSSVRVSPNPSAAAFLIQAQGQFSYSVSNPVGKVLATGKATEQTAVGNGLPAGLYLIRVEQNGQTKTIKVIKQ